MTGNITSADSILTITAPGVYNSPVQIQGFATDDAFDFPDVETKEFQLGVDGQLAAGWVPVMFTQNIALLANSDSNEIFEQIHQREQQLRTAIVLSGTAIIPGVSRKWALTGGYLKTFPPAPPVKKTLQPRRYSLVWTKMSVSRYSGL